MATATVLDPLLEWRWSVFVTELATTSTGGSLPIELQTLPLELVAAGSGHRLLTVASELLHALRLQAHLLQSTTEGPRHAAFAAALAAVSRAGVILDDELADLQARWTRAARSRRSRTAYTFDELAPFVPPRRR